MNAPHFPRTEMSGAAFRAHGMFDLSARECFALHYPERPHTLRHGLEDHPLLNIDQLAMLAECLPQESVEYNRGDLPIGVDGKPESNGLSIGETIRQVYKSNSWAVLKNIEQAPTYRTLLTDLLSDLEGEIEQATGPMLDPQAYIFISSPNAVTPYHFDPEHNLLLQIRGTKAMTQFPAGDARFASDKAHEDYHYGGPRELRWNDSFRKAGKTFVLEEGEAVYVPVMAPHFVQNGPYSSISLSITWRSKWSYAESEARGMNRWLRARGRAPKTTKRWPHNNRMKSLAFRTLRKLGLT